MLLLAPVVMRLVGRVRRFVTVEDVHMQLFR
jgi:hypothetical protein